MKLNLDTRDRHDYWEPLGSRANVKILNLYFKQLLIVVATLMISGPLLAKDTLDLDKQADLPPRGQSTFDLLIASQKQQTVPYPFTKLIDLLRANIVGNDKIPISMLMFPYGRSLQRFAAAPKFFKYPRLVLTVNTQAPYDFQNPQINMQSALYIAYVEPSNTLEVISFNQEAARFEFQVVKNYQAGKKPELYYAPRKLCNSCHQAEIPIFAAEPWTESNDNDLLAKEIVKARKSEEYFGFPIMLKDMPGRIFSDEAMKFDFDVLESGKRQFSHRMVEKICDSKPSERIECRATGIKLAFAAQFNYWPGPNWSLLKSYSEIMDRYYKNNKTITVPFPFLPDRDPIDNTGVFGDSHKLPVSQWPSKNMAENLKQLINNITNLPANHDPLHSRLEQVEQKRSQCQLPLKRAPIAYKKYCHLSYFARSMSINDSYFIRDLFSREKEGKPKELDFKRFASAIDVMKENAIRDERSALARPHLQRDLILKELYEIANPGKKAKLCCNQKLTQKPRLLPTGVKIENVFDANLKPFFKHCASCHDQASIKYPDQFLFALTEAELKQSMKTKKDLITRSLENLESPMPPISASRQDRLEEDTRKDMLDYLKAL